MSSDEEGSARPGFAPLVWVAASVTIVCVATDRFLYIDGAYFFHRQVTERGFFAFDVPRLHAQYLTQLPTWLAMQLGVVDRRPLAAIAGAGLYWIPLAAVLLTGRLLDRKALMVFPAIGFLASTLLALGYPISESHVMAAVYWVVLAVLSRSKVEWPHFTLLVGLLVLSLRLYESYMLLAPSIAALIVWQAWREEARTRRAAWLLCLVLVGYGAWIALASSLAPRDPGNARQFADALGLALRQSAHLHAIGAMLAISFAWSWRRGSPAPSRWTAPLVLLASLVAFGLRPEWLAIDDTYSLRSLLTSVPLVVGAAFCACVLRDAAVERLAGQLRAGVLCGLVYVFALQCVASLQWFGYLERFRGVLEADSPSPIVDYRETPLAERRSGRQLLADFGASWTYPVMSSVLSGGYPFVVVVDPDARFVPLEPRELLASIRLGERVPFGSPLLRYTGWSEASAAGGRRSLGAQAEIGFHLEPDHARRSAPLLLRAQVAARGRQRILVRLDGAALGELVADSDDEIVELPIDGARLSGDALHRLRFEVREAEQGQASGSLEPGIEVAWISLETRG